MGGKGHTDSDISSKINKYGGRETERKTFYDMQ